MLRGAPPVLRGAPLGAVPVLMGYGALDGAPDTPELKGTSPGGSENPEPLALGKEPYRRCKWS